MSIKTITTYTCDLCKKEIPLTYKSLYIYNEKECDFDKIADLCSSCWGTLNSKIFCKEKI